MRHGRWTAEETAWLRENYPRLGYRACAGLLDRGPRGVRTRAAALGLRMEKEALSRLMSESVRASLRRLRARRAFGLEIRRHMPWRPYTMAQRAVRRRALDNGYTLGSPYESGERMTLYYDAGTRRRDFAERTAERRGFRIAELRPSAINNQPLTTNH